MNKNNILKSIYLEILKVIILFVESIENTYYTNSFKFINFQKKNLNQISYWNFENPSFFREKSFRKILKVSKSCIKNLLKEIEFKYHLMVQINIFIDQIMFILFSNLLNLHIYLIHQ